MGSTGYAEKTIIFRGASMKNLKKKVHFRIKLKSKHLLVIMSIFCVSCIAATFSSGVTTAPLQDAAGILIVPFENSINRISSVLKGMQDRMRDKEEILSENENLKAQIDSLTEQNNKLIQDQTELVRLQQMYNLDQQYTEYPKVAAEIISKDPGNWYDTFMINRGSADGIRVDKDAHEVTVDGKPVDLSNKEFELLTYFMENKGIALSREKILNNVWNYDYFGDARTIDTHVKKLRSKLGPKGDNIKTIWGMGYKLEVDG